MGGSPAVDSVGKNEDGDIERTKSSLTSPAILDSKSEVAVNNEASRSTPSKASKMYVCDVPHLPCQRGSQPAGYLTLIYGLPTWVVFI